MIQKFYPLLRMGINGLSYSQEALGAVNRIRDGERVSREHGGRLKADRVDNYRSVSRKCV